MLIQVLFNLTRLLMAQLFLFLAKRTHVRERRLQTKRAALILSSPSSLVDQNIQPKDSPSQTPVSSAGIKLLSMVLSPTHEIFGALGVCFSFSVSMEK